MITRRTFLRVLGSAAVGAIVVPRLPLPIVEPAATFADFTLASTRPLTLEMLEASYKACVAGSREPNLIICHASVARKLGLVYDAEIEEAA